MGILLMDDFDFDSVYLRFRATDLDDIRTALMDFGFLQSLTVSWFVTVSYGPCYHGVLIEYTYRPGPVYIGRVRYSDLELRSVHTDYQKMLFIMRLREDAVTTMYELMENPAHR